MKFEIKIANGEYGEDRELDIQKCFAKLQQQVKYLLMLVQLPSVIKV